MRWLQWSTIDLENGLGGVEVHARCLARELRALGIETAFSNRSSDFQDPRWDVIHTHGSAVLSIPLKARRPAIHVHTLHGTTFGRILACRELLWPGGYAAALRETLSLKAADVVLSVHPRLHLLAAAQALGKTTAVCWNGWDSAFECEPLPDGISAAGAWVFIGRGSDWVKAADRLSAAITDLRELRFLAAPGEGFEDNPRVKPTGRLTPAQVRTLLKQADGLVLPSRYEGNSLVLLEALSQGTPAVATQVGAIGSFPRPVEGLVIAKSGSPRDIAAAIKIAAKLPKDPASRERRAAHNQQALPTWREVAETALRAVERAR